jgi:hypothetical protein
VDVWKYVMGSVHSTNCVYEIKERPKVLKKDADAKKGFKIKGQLKEITSKEQGVKCGKEG